jgi:hypothetical protein
MKAAGLAGMSRHRHTVTTVRCDSQVTINDLVLAVNIAFGSGQATECAAADRNLDGEVVINELVAAVNAALAGCS